MKCLRLCLSCLLASIWLLAACDGPASPPRPPASVEAISPVSQSAPVGTQLSEPLVIRATDARGRGAPNVQVSWVVDSGGGAINPQNSSTGADGMAKAQWTLGTAAGEQKASALINGQTVVTFAATATPGPVASLSVSPEQVSLRYADSVRISAILKDRFGNLVTTVSPTWTSSDTSKVKVSSTGAVRGVGVGPAVIMASVGQQSAEVPATVTPLRFTSIHSGIFHACGLLEDGAAYCWGRNSSGQLGDGTTASSVKPVRVSGGLTLRSLAVGDEHTCGVSTEGTAHCWGNNSRGQLGNGSTTRRVSPTPVSGGLSVSAISAGQAYTCAVTPEGAAYCWGAGEQGQLGNGTTGAVNPLPQRVSGDLPFRSISAGYLHTCAVTVENQGYCWGYSLSGQTGTHQTYLNTPLLVPHLVRGGLNFRSVDASINHTCGTTLDNRAYCWGDAAGGKLGQDPSVALHRCPAGISIRGIPCAVEPVPVQGDHAFRLVSAGGSHTCAVSAADVAYCWGGNRTGELGNGSRDASGAPVAVAGNLLFEAVSNSGFYESYTCGLTKGKLAYCWGAAPIGQSAVPAMVPGQR